LPNIEGRTLRRYEGGIRSGQIENLVYLVYTSFLAKRAGTVSIRKNTGMVELVGDWVEAAHPRDRRNKILGIGC
jgi:hypothetical protein